jgi:membrane associated rhomboid family serine protease
MFNVPPVVAATLVAMGIVHAVRVLLLSPRANVEFLLLFSFIPARYDSTLLAQGVVPGGLAADIWSFVTYALIHGDITHIGLNAVWLLAFGTPVARRFGPWRFLVFFAVTAAAGAALHLVTHPGDLAPMVGASAAISGYMAAAIRFVFQGGGPLEMWRTPDSQAYRVPAAPLTAVLKDPRILAFLAVWFGLNILLGLGTLAITESEAPIAWQAHIGGFLAGLLLFAAFDPFGNAAPRDEGADPDPNLNPDPSLSPNPDPDPNPDQDTGRTVH